MNRQKSVLFTAVLVATVGGAALVLLHNSRNTNAESNPALGQKVLGDFPVNTVARIIIRHGTHHVTLDKTEGLWRVEERSNYPANFDQIRDFLLKAKDLKVIQSEPVTPAQLPRLQLVDDAAGTNAALIVEFQDLNRNNISTLLLGKPHLNDAPQPSPYGGPAWPNGRYVKTASADFVALVDDPLDNIEPRPESWLDKDFIHVDKPKSIEVVFPESTNSWHLTRATPSGPWQLEGAAPDEKLDPARLASLSDPLASAEFADVEDGDSAPLARATNPPVRVSIQTFDGFNYALKVGGKTNSDYAVTVAVSANIPAERVAAKDEKPEDKARLDKEFQEHRQKLEEKLKQEKACAGWVYFVQGWTVDGLLRHRAELLAAETKTASATPGLPRAAATAATQGP